MGAYYVKENEAHGYTEVCLPVDAAALAPDGLLESSNNVAGWRAIIRQLVDQLAAGELALEEATARRAGLSEFAGRVLDTRYAFTPMRARVSRNREVLDDASVDEAAGDMSMGGMSRDVQASTLQRLEDSVGLLRGELGVCEQGARYITLHGGVGALGESLVQMCHEVASLGKGLAVATKELGGVSAEVRHARDATDSLSHEVHEFQRAAPSTRTIAALYQELQLVKAERGELEATVLTLSLSTGGD